MKPTIKFHEQKEGYCSECKIQEKNLIEIDNKFYHQYKSWSSKDGSFSLHEVTVKKDLTIERVKEKEELQKLRNYKKLSLQYANNWYKSGTDKGRIQSRIIIDILKESGAWEENDSIS